jgi:hypothetical protein
MIHNISYPIDSFSFLFLILAAFLSELFNVLFCHVFIYFF